MLKPCIVNINAQNQTFVKVYVETRSELKDYECLLDIYKKINVLGAEYNSVIGILQMCDLHAPPVEFYAFPQVKGGGFLDDKI